MNIKNNKQRQRSRTLIENVFIDLLQEKELQQISVTMICQKAKLNRSTFYANYIDMYDLVDSIRKGIEAELNLLYKNDMIANCFADYLNMFTHIKKNQEMYRVIFKLGIDKVLFLDSKTNNFLGSKVINKNKNLFVENHLKYHLTFHEAGTNAIIRQWLKDGCKESPEEMQEIIENEYSGRYLK